MHRSCVWRVAADVPARSTNVLRRAPKHAILDHAAEMSAALGQSASPAEPALRYAFLRHGEPEPLVPGVQQRMSPAARLGSSKVDGNAIIAMPDALRERVSTMVRRSNKDQLRRDTEHMAKLERENHALDPTGLAMRASQRFILDLPRQRAVPLYLATQFSGRYAVLVRVLDEARRRILAGGKVWRPTRVMDLAMHTSELWWAYDRVFGAQTLQEYVGEARHGTLLKAHIALQEDPAWEHVRTTFRVRGDRPHVYRDVQIQQTPLSTLAVHAFGLSTAATDMAREREVLRLWKSDADVLVLVEEATPRGFASIASARSQLLSLGKTASACHVVAPCAHDKACPLLHAFESPVGRTSKAPKMCTYSQMYQVPPFMRATTQVHRGDATAAYCYLIIQRGARPTLETELAEWTKAVPSSLQPYVGESVRVLSESSRKGILDELRSGRILEVADKVDQSHDTVETCTSALGESGVDAHRVMQIEAFSWPRLIRSPLKKGGHVTLDACCANGEIQRFTIAKSSGRQAYQDARKAQHGELYAHMRSGSRASTNVPSPSGALADPRAAPDTPEHVYLGPDAQLEARTSGRIAKRTSSRAPKRRAIMHASNGSRLSRKQSRGDLDHLLNSDEAL